MKDKFVALDLLNNMAAQSTERKSKDEGQKSPGGRKRRARCKANLKRRTWQRWQRRQE
jgi:hypothetical protein